MTFRSLLVLSLLSGLPVLAQGTTLRLGTWNLEFLGAEGDFRNKLPLRDDQDYQQLGAKVRELGVAVLAVQEICGEAPLRKVAAAAGPGWQVLLGTTGGWDDGKTSQQIGFLYDAAAVELLQAEELLQLPREVDGVPIFHRVPVTACFRSKATGFDFRAVTVHLKAGQKAQDQQKRKLEATALKGWLDTLLQRPGEDQDVVVLGDFNSTYGTEPQTVLEQGGALQYTVPATATPTIMHFPEAIDQVVVARGFDELHKASFTVHSDYGGLDKDAWRKTYSDHYPVTVALTAGSDTDPQASFLPVLPDQKLPATNRPATAAPAAKATAAPLATSAPQGTPPWPLPAGTRVRVRYGAGGTAGQAMVGSGTLERMFPAGANDGWIVLRTEANRLLAVPREQVLSLETW